MRHYALRRFTSLFLYFFGMYSLITAIWYSVNGRFKASAAEAVSEIVLHGGIFALMFGLLMMVLYRRKELRLPVLKVKNAQLEQGLQQIGYEPSKKQPLAGVKVYKPVPPVAASLAGKLFLHKTANFYHLEGPAKYVDRLEKLVRR